MSSPDNQDTPVKRDLTPEAVDKEGEAETPEREQRGLLERLLPKLKPKKKPSPNIYPLF